MKRRLILQSMAGSAATIGAGWLAPARAAEGAALSARHVTLGSSLALSGILASAGKDYVDGMNAAFEQVNKAGGIHGREVRLMAMDDGYAPPRTLQNVKQAIEGDQCFAFISQIGTANTAAILPLVEQAGVPLLGPITGAASLRKKEHRYVFHVRPSYSDEVMHAMRLFNTMSVKDVAVVYLDNGFGKEVAKDAAAAIERLQLRSVGSFSLALDGSNGEKLAQDVLAAGATGVFLATTGTSNTAFVLPLRKKLPAFPVVGLSVSLIPSEIDKLGDYIKGLAVARVFPRPELPTVAAVRHYQATMKAANVARVNGSTFEAWINAQVMLEALRRTGRDLTRDRLRQSLASIKRLDLGDYSLGYEGSGPYVASERVDISVFGDKGRVIS